MDHQKKRFRLPLMAFVQIPIVLKCSTFDVLIFAVFGVIWLNAMIVSHFGKASAK